MKPPISYADLQRMPVLMVYLAAFQNGFFWKKLFEQRRRALSDAR